MRILHISTGQAGAGICAYRIHEALKQRGEDSRMIVYSRPDVMDDTISAPYQRKGLRAFVYKAYHRILRLMHIFVYETDKMELYKNREGGFYSLPVSKIDITNHPWVEWADVIHLHWCNNFFNQPLFFQKIKDKPIIWTLHDENFFYGISHYRDSLLKENELEDKYRAIKHKMISEAKNLGVVMLTETFYREFSKHPLLQGKNIRVINNPINFDAFKPKSRIEARKDLKMSEDEKILLFVSVKIIDKHKGLFSLISAVEKLQRKDIRIVAVGDDTGFEGSEYVTTVGKVYDTQMLSLYYSAADLFILPSQQESFSQTIIEAMACGTPAVAYPVGIAPDVVRANTGELCAELSESELSNKIEAALEKDYNGEAIREFVINRFSPNHIADQYVNYYQYMLDDTKA